MKKILTAVLAAVFVFAAAACGTTTAPTDSTAQTQSAQSPADAVDLAGVMQEMLDSVSLPDMMTLTQDDLIDYFGLEPQWCADSAACINSNGYEKDEIVLVRAADTESAAQIRACLQTSLENAAAEMQNYLPEQYAMIQNCKVESRDLYVWLFISDKADQLQTILDKYF